MKFSVIFLNQTGECQGSTLEQTTVTSFHILPFSPLMIIFSCCLMLCNVIVTQINSSITDEVLVLFHVQRLKLFLPSLSLSPWNFLPFPVLFLIEHHAMKAYWGVEL
jgi:hypothetical protein